MIICGICKSSNQPPATSCATCGALLIRASQAQASPAPSPQQTPQVPYTPPAGIQVPSGSPYAPQAPYAPGAQPYHGATPPSAAQGTPQGPPRAVPGAHVIRVSARTISWPGQCACWSDRNDSTLRAEYTRTTGKRVIRTDTRFWEVPYCTTCLGHVQMMQSGASMQGTGIIVTILSVLFLPCLAFLLFIPLGTLALGIYQIWSGASTKQKAHQAMSGTCGCAEAAVVYHGWDGSIQSFTFRNGVYAEAFRAANARKLLG